MSINLRHMSASSIQKFVACPRQWALRYDNDLKADDSSDAAERGTIVHRALELWKNPNNGYGTSFEEFKRAYENAGSDSKVPVSWSVYQAGFELLPKAYEFTVTHPFLPLDRTRIWAVEAKIDFWLARSSWALPLIGYIDTLEIVVPRASHPQEIILVVGDYKTGRSKPKEDLLEDIQPPLYMAWAIMVCKPALEAVGFVVKQVMNVWTYIADSIAIPLFDSDFDLEAVLGYVGAVSKRIVEFNSEYNALPESKRLEFLAKHERRNEFCNWCIGKNTCNQFKRAVNLRMEVDLANTPLAEICAERDAAALAATSGEEQRQAIDRMLRMYLEQNNLDCIQENGRVYKTISVTNQVVENDAIASVFGAEFFVRNAKMNKDVVDKELASLKLLDPERYEAVSAYLKQRTIATPGARYIKAKDAPKPKESKRGAKLASN